MQQISLSGTGGQGLILAGTILAEAAILCGQYAIQTQSYGPEARGGASKAEVLIADEAIDYPKVLSADIMLTMSQAACDKYIHMLKPGGKLIVDTTFVKDIPKVDADILAVDITKITKDTLNNIMVANIVALGILAAYSNTADKESVVATVLKRVPKGTEELNKKAIDLGFSLAESKI